MPPFFYAWSLSNSEDSAGNATKYYGVSGYVDKCQGVKC